MPTSLLIDGITGQPRVARGRFVQTDATAARVLARLRTKRGTAPWDPTFGSRLHLVTKADTLAVSATRAEILRALEPEVQSGAIRKVEVDVELQATRRGQQLRWEVRYTTADGTPRTERGGN